MTSATGVRFGALLPLSAALGAGALRVIQSRVNGGLATQLHSGPEAALISFSTGLVILTVLVVLVRPLRTGLASVGKAVRSGQVRPWAVLGGFLGAFFVSVQSTTVPMIGVAVFTVAIVAGQSSASLVVDWIGYGSAARKPISKRRITAAVLAVIAVLVSVSDRVGGASISVLAIAFAILAGSLSAVQQAVNGRVSIVARQPVSAAWVNFLGGTVALLVVVAVSGAAGATAVSAPTGGWWLYLGGACGVAIVALGAWLVPRVGVLVAALLTTLGQLSFALALDVIVPTEGTSVGWPLITGVLLTLVAALLATTLRADRPEAAPIP
jgi:transporter family-2 protein